MSRLTYDLRRGCQAYLDHYRRIDESLPGSVVENVVVDPARRTHSKVTTTFDELRRGWPYLLGVEVIGARELLSAAVLAAADER